MLHDTGPRGATSFLACSLFANSKPVDFHGIRRGAFSDFQGEKRLIIDCSALEFISSAGLRSLLLAVKKMKAAGGVIGLAALQPNVKEVFDISGFSALFTIHSTTAEALA